MLTKNAIGNMINRYNAVLSKCRLLNVFGTLAIAGTIVLGSGPCGLSGVSSAYAATTSEYDACTTVDYVEGGVYYAEYFTLDGHKGVVLTPKGASAVATVDDFILGYTTDGGYTFTKDTETYSFTVGMGNTYYMKAPASDSTTTTTIFGQEDSALENDEANASITADFIANKNSADSTTSTDNGGAINNTATNVTISGDFIGNWASFHGGAVYNTSSITSITSNFIGNSTILQGGAICNSGSIGNISGDFIGNISGGSGAAIFNDSGTIDTISGDFAGNKAGGSGGAIQNSNGTITTISGTFSGNTSADVGGAICNFADSNERSTIGNSEDSSTGIIANFVNNTAKKGGAIYNSERATITSISGDFIGNKATGASTSKGGAIYNDGTISSISSNFTGNSADGTYGKGGAIYNNEGDTISSISGNFTGNKAGSQGGAIFTDGNLTFLSAGSAYSFTNNVAGSGDTADYNAINSFKDIALTFKLGDANNANGSFTMNDGIAGKDYTVAITGDGAGEDIGSRTFKLNDEIDGNGTVTVTGATLTLGTFKHTGATDVHGTALGESTTVGSVLGSLTVGTTDDHAKLLVNLEDTNQTATINDLTVTAGSSLELAAGTLNLTNISAPFNGTMTASAGTTLKLGDTISKAVIFDHADAVSDISAATVITDNALTIKSGTLVVAYDAVVGTDGALHDKVMLNGESTSSATLTLHGSGELNSKDYSDKLDAVATAFKDDGITRDAHMTDFSSDKGTVKVDGFNLTENYLASFLTKVRMDVEGVYIYAVETIDYDSSAESDQNTLIAGTRLIAKSLNGAGKSGASFEIAENAYLVLGGETLANADTVTNKGMLALQDGVFNAALNATDTATTIIEGTVSLNKGVTSSGTTTFKGEITLKDTLTINGGKTIFKETATVEGITNITGGALGIDNTSSDAVTLAGVNVGEKGVFDIDNGKVVLTKDSALNGTLFMGQGTGIEVDGAHVTIHEGPNTPDAYLFAKGSDSAITVESLGGRTANFNAYADEGGKLIFGALPTAGESKVQYDYIASQMGDAFNAKDMLYVGLGETLTMASGASLVVDGAPLGVTNTPMSLANAIPVSKPNVVPNADGANFGTNSLFIANVAGLDTDLGADQAVIDGSGNALTVDAHSTLGLVNAGEGEYIILDNFGTVTNADTNNEGNTVPWNEESVTIGNCLLVVDSVTGSGTDADPYKVKVRQDVDEDLYDTDGGGALEDVMNSGEYGPSTTNALAQYLYQAGEKGDKALDKAKANTASAGANARSGATGMAATRAAAATMSMRNIAMHKSAHKFKAAGGTLLIKDANGNVKAEYDNVVQVADSGSTSDVPTAFGSTDTGLANSISLWAMPFYGHESISGAHVGSHSNDTRTDMYGMTLGMDKTFTPSGIDLCRVGFAFNVGTGETEGSGYTGSSESTFDFFGLAAYGSMRKGAAMLSASVSYTNNDSEFNSEGIRGETDANVWYGALNGEYAFTLSALESLAFFSNFNIIPYVGIGFMTNKVDDYATSLGSSVETDRQSIFTIPLGFKFSKEFLLDSGWVLKPEIGAGVIFAHGDLYQRTVTGNTLGSSLDTIRSQVMDRATMDLGFSLDMRKGDFGIFLDYSLEKSDTRTAHGVSAKFEYQF